MNQIHSVIREAIKTRGIHSLRVRISFLLILAAGILTFTISFVALNLFSNHTRAEHLKTAKGVALLAANSIQADSIETYLAQGKDVPGYQKTFVYLKSLQKSIPDIKYLYVYQIKEDGCHIIFDTDEEAGDYQVNEIIEFDPTFLPLIDELLAGKEIEPLESNDQLYWNRYFNGSVKTVPHDFFVQDNCSFSDCSYTDRWFWNMDFYKTSC